MTDYETKDSGQHQEYDSGMRRDSQAGKPRFGLIRTKLQPYDDQMITRYAKLLARGAEKYEDRNWEQGDSEVELERAKDSLLRHVEQLIAGETDEDHAAGAWFNVQAIEYFRWRIEQKKKKESTNSMTLEFDINPNGDKFVQMVTGGMITTFRGDMKPRVNVDPRGIVSEQIAEVPLPKAPDLPKVVSPEPTHDFQRIINEWHNRPEYSVPHHAVVDPPAALEDVRLARIGQDILRGVRTMRRRVDAWLSRYRINLISGDLGDAYEEITLPEFESRLSRVQWSAIPLPPRVDIPSFD